GFGSSPSGGTCWLRSARSARLETSAVPMGGFETRFTLLNHLASSPERLDNRRGELDERGLVGGPLAVDGYPRSTHEHVDEARGVVDGLASGERGVTELL